MMQLVNPCLDYKGSFLNALAEFEAEGTHGNALARSDFDAYLARVDLNARGVDLREGIVPETTLWLVDGGEYIGTTGIRHRLNEKLIEFGGHIGYSIRPTKRRRGYGKKILELALPIAAELGIERALVTCDETNIASRKIIEANGGVLEDRVIIQGRDVPILRFWIDLSSSHRQT
jgi:predicted acetyltransferase